MVPLIIPKQEIVDSPGPLEIKTDLENDLDLANELKINAKKVKDYEEQLNLIRLEMDLKEINDKVNILQELEPENLDLTISSYPMDKRINSEMNELEVDVVLDCERVETGSKIDSGIYLPIVSSLICPGFDFFPSKKKFMFFPKTKISQYYLFFLILER